MNSDLTQVINITNQKNIIKKIKNNLNTINEFFSVLLKCVGLCGMAILTIYFMSIDFLPVSDFQTPMYLLLFIAIFGIIFLAFIAASFVLPSLLWVK